MWTFPKKLLYQDDDDDDDDDDDNGDQDNVAETSFVSRIRRRGARTRRLFPFFTPDRDTDLNNSHLNISERMAPRDISQSGTPLIKHSRNYIPDMARPRGVRLLAMIFTCLTIELLSVADGRKCVCTSKPCLKAGVDTCRTRFFCYTEVILNDEDQGNTTTLGCTELVMPVLCEGPSVGHLQVISLRCCDSHDYCNGEVPASPVLQEQDQRKPGTSTLQIQDRSHPVVNLTGTRVGVEKPSDPPDRYHDKKLLDSTSSASTTVVCSNVTNSMTTHQVRPLHVAALVLTVAAIISVFAACYVINSFLRSHHRRHHHHHPAAANDEEICRTCRCKCRSESFPEQNLDFGINIRNNLQEIKSSRKSSSPPPPPSPPLPPSSFSTSATRCLHELQ